MMAVVVSVSARQIPLGHMAFLLIMVHGQYEPIHSAILEGRFPYQFQMSVSLARTLISQQSLVSVSNQSDRKPLLRLREDCLQTPTSVALNLIFPLTLWALVPTPIL